MFWCLHHDGYDWLYDKSFIPYFSKDWGTRYDLSTTFDQLNACTLNRDGDSTVYVVSISHEYFAPTLNDVPHLFIVPLSHWWGWLAIDKRSSP